MFPNSNENVGSVEDLENILAADIHGKFTGVAPNYDKHE